MIDSFSFMTLLHVPTKSDRVYMYSMLPYTVYCTTSYFSYIFHIKSQFFKKLLQSHFLSDFYEIFTNEQRIFSSLIVYLDKIFFPSVFKNS